MNSLTALLALPVSQFASCFLGWIHLEGCFPYADRVVNPARNTFPSDPNTVFAAFLCNIATVSAYRRNRLLVLISSYVAHLVL